MRIIAGTARSRVIEAPRGMDIRPTLDRVRENLFNVISRRVPGARVLDLFAGSGALALEARSRGAASAVLNDRDREAQRVEQRNTETLGFVGRARLLRGDWQQALRLLQGEDARFDLVFLDPPYAMEDLQPVTEALLPLLAEDARVIIEHQAGHPSRVCGELETVDSRRWGYAGVSICRVRPEPSASPEASPLE